MTLLFCVCVGWGGRRGGKAGVQGKERDAQGIQNNNSHK